MIIATEGINEGAYLQFTLRNFHTLCMFRACTCIMLHGHHAHMKHDTAFDFGHYNFYLILRHNSIPIIATVTALLLTMNYNFNPQFNTIQGGRRQWHLIM